MPFGVHMNIKIRPLNREEASYWVSLGIPEDEKTTREQQLKKYLDSNPNLPPENYLVAEYEGRLVGKLSGVRESTGYMATRMFIHESVDRLGVATKLVEYVRPFGITEALSWKKPEDEDWRHLLQVCGFRIVQDKGYFRKEIAGFKSPYVDPFTYVSLKKLGEEKLLGIFGSIYIGNLNRNFNSESPESDYRSHIESAGDLFDPDSWFAVFKDGKAAGILFPQRFPDTPHDGTLTAFGLSENFRGQGFAKILHAKGLEILSDQGAADYIGSTDVQNLPMLKVFEVNGCRNLGVRTTHRL